MVGVEVDVVSMAELRAPSIIKTEAMTFSNVLCTSFSSKKFETVDVASDFFVCGDFVCAQSACDDIACLVLKTSHMSDIYKVL